MVSEIRASQRSTETMRKTMREEEEEYKCMTQKGQEDQTQKHEDKRSTSQG